MNFEFIDTERLQLRKITPEGFNYIFENFSEKEIKEFLGIVSEEGYERERMKYEQGLTTFNRTFLIFTIIEKSTNRAIGGFAFHNLIHEHSRSEIGYHLNDDSHKQKGYMSEVMIEMLQYGFNELKLNRIEACVGPLNMASLQLVKKFNFQQEGILRDHYRKNGVIGDSIIFSLLKSEYDTL